MANTQSSSWNGASRIASRNLQTIGTDHDHADRAHSATPGPVRKAIMDTATANPATGIPEVVLNSSTGRKAMPVIGFGTAAESNDALISAILEAIKLGYRHFDTASMYGSEQALGEAIAEALKLDLVGSRDELFITPKLWPSDAHDDLVVLALQKSIRTSSSH
ncbi:hypothetical protein I3843_10G107300 [Carya illinoinensis]|nr:hypothetical protein I3843_10G107300 [Carya illinoinensis]